MRKKKWFFTALFCAGLSLVSCGKPGDSEANDYATTTEPTAEDTTDETAAPENGKAEPVSFVYEENSGGSPEEDRNYSYIYDYSRPVITIAGNETAARRIQESIDAQIERFLAYVNGGEFGEVFEDGPAMQAYDKLGIAVMRADDKVVSLQFMEEGYNGGAHGWVHVSYRNYFTSTGDEITFADFGEKFREKAMELVEKKADEIQAKEPIFFDDYAQSIPLVVLDGTEDMNEVYESIYDWWGEENNMKDATSSPTYYITADGFVFVSGQYILQPYAAGIVDFAIPYEDFGDDYTGNIF